MIEVEVSGDFKNSERFLKTMATTDFAAAVKGVAERGVAKLRAATPVDSGETAESWGFVIQRSRKSFSITWTNSNTENGFPVAIMLQYGHGTGTGGWVRGRDYINPAIQPIIDEIAEDLWKVVTSA